MHASGARTPTLLIAGAKDRCSPAGQAREFYQALISHGVDSELVIYPGEGHGVSRFTTQEPAMTVRDWISLAGLVVSVIGFSVIIWQFTRAANAREETRPASGQN